MDLSPARPPSEPPARPSILAGAGALLFGLRWLAERRDLWLMAAVPALLTLVLGTFGSGAGIYFGYHYSHRLLASHLGVDLAGLLSYVLLFIVAVSGGVLGMFLGASLAVPLSGPALERIAAAMQRHLGLPESAEQGLGGFAHSLAATVLTWAAGFLGVGSLTLLGVLVPIVLPVTLPLKGMLVAWLLTFDLGDPAFGLMGMSLGARMEWLRTHLGAALGFGTLAALLLCVPVLGLFVLPAAVAGVTSLVATDRSPT